MGTLNLLTGGIVKADDYQLSTGQSLGKCLAWTNFNGTGTIVQRKQLNISGITDNGPGDYTANFLTAMPDANYCPATSARIAAALGLNTAAFRMFGYTTGGSIFDQAPTTTAFRFGTLVQGTNNNQDCDYVCVSVFD
jgi:hypothetical protein